MQLGATLCKVHREDHSAELTSKLRPDMYTLLYLKWMMTKDLLKAQGTMLNPMWQPGWRGPWGRMDTPIRVAESLCCLSETVTTLSVSYVVVQSLSHDLFFATPWTVACRAPQSFTISQTVPKFTSIESVMPLNHLILRTSISSCPQSLPASGFFPMS